MNLARTLRRLSIWISLCVTVVGVVSFSAADDFRYWTTSKGERSAVKLKVVEHEEDRVTLQREDNARQVTIGVDILSAADRQYLTAREEPVVAADTPQTITRRVVGYRNDGTGVYPDAHPPTRWSAEENVVWKTELPFNGPHQHNLSSPLIVGDRIFVVTDPAELVCIDRKTGGVLWQKSNGYEQAMTDDEYAAVQRDWARVDEIEKEKSEIYKKAREAGEGTDEARAFHQQIRVLDDERGERMRHYRPNRNENRPDMQGNTAAIPASDGRHVAAVFGTGVTAVYTLEGEQKWIKALGGAHQHHGVCASPLVVDGMLITKRQEKILALEMESGEERWSTELEYRHSSPILANYQGEKIIVTGSRGILRASGEHLFNIRQSHWKMNCSNGSPLVAGDKFYYINDQLLAYDLSEEAPRRPVWESSKSVRDHLGSPLLVDGIFYVLMKTGIIHAIDAEDGETVYSKRLGLEGNCYSDPVYAAGNIYVSSTSGTTIVFKAGRQYEKVAENSLGEPYGRALTLADNRIYIQGQKHLYCISN